MEQDSLAPQPKPGRVRLPVLRAMAVGANRRQFRESRKGALRDLQVPGQPNQLAAELPVLGALVKRV
ncbi:hypothetical protein OU5_3522 [Pseudomonas mandelii JR-1]|uniref:Uncharacterized protein n=1 Tax=Pseudomonas mandelii JR-1 TaxID=1147786 RepID=A0A024EDB5_9PSED|nr:hypothetical protein OU5_3522 [Pseudomonas mandelii JR-1]